MIDLDAAATSPLSAAARAEFTRLLNGPFGNPSGQHRLAQAAKSELEEARDFMAADISASAREVVFTGSGTEADNLALKGVARAARRLGRGDHLVISAIEHKAVLESAHALENEGFSVSYVPVTASGLVTRDALVSFLRPETILVSVIALNNEIGVAQDIVRLARVVHKKARRAVFHTDAVQAAGVLDLRAIWSDVDLLTVSAHKFGGPKGVGALFVKESVEIDPEIVGGGQELGLRSGTSDVMGARAMSAAFSEAIDSSGGERVHELINRFIAGVTAGFPSAFVHGDSRVGGIANICFPGVESDALLVLLDQVGVCASSGASCTSGATEVSHVLSALGVRRELAMNSVRFSASARNTAEEMDEAASIVVRCCRQLMDAGAEALV